jgi:hypothetical protein
MWQSFLDSRFFRPELCAKYSKTFPDIDYSLGQRCQEPTMDDFKTKPTNEQYGVKFFKYDPKGCPDVATPFGVHFDDGSFNWLPRHSLDGIDDKFISEAMLNPGKRRKLTGARKTKNKSAVMKVNNFITVTGSLLFQRASGGYCALNAVYNAFVVLSKAQPDVKSFSSALYKTIWNLGSHTMLEHVTQHVDSTGIAQFSRPREANNNRIQKLKLLQWLKTQKTGCYVVEFDQHVVTWNADQQLIIESDADYPSPISITDESLTSLNITRDSVEKVYRFHPRYKRFKKKRKHSQMSDSSPMQ